MVQGAVWTLCVELRFYLLIGVFMAVGMTRADSSPSRCCGR